MNVRTATVREASKDVSAVRAAPRGVVVAVSRRQAGNPTDLKVRAEKVAAVAATHAAAVDRDSRLPKEAIEAARAERLFGIAVPREFGGDGAGIADVVDVCYALGRACASTAMWSVMHEAAPGISFYCGGCVTNNCCSLLRPRKVRMAATSATA
jgi:hypothetical protein